ncbi:Aquaglyceroporin 1 [Trypanosoma equiperdum]|uniref:Aquaporin 3, putative n=2 Tax=Trypanozoon TaxID=39700 RepID=Q585Q8_TRYB2|nr:aquaporin 3, putative [Trypanosoma brucei brucei TREU927]AAX79702.1 aquaporin 3, putative [Trypanosoma brucei]AAZ11715.1 aquaporin 3, putative [Trypanosoma brucei brucei TREU927]SCU73227.1 Aquaglyceroporin 1 [Trypanosoma equiperdum]
MSDEKINVHQYPSETDVRGLKARNGGACEVPFEENNEPIPNRSANPQEKNENELVGDNADNEAHDAVDVNYWAPRQLRLDYRNYMGEFLGTFVLLFMGNGVVATTILDKDLGFLSITLGWGIAVTMGLYISLGISCGHLNPAVTLANAVFGCFPWRRVPGYIAAQMLGAFVGAACAYGVYADLLKQHSGGLVGFGDKGFAGMFSTYPREGNRLFYCIFSEFICTAILLFCVGGIFDPNNSPAKGHEPLAVGALVFAIGNNIGYASGYAINPARDFGPRVFSAILFGSEVFTTGNYYFWVPLFIPFLGGIFGLFLYKYFVPY